MSAPVARTVRIGEWTAEVVMCGHPGCVSAGGPTGLCWAHRSEEAPDDGA